MKFTDLIPKVFAQDIVGSVDNPLQDSYQDFDTTGKGITLLFSNLLRVVFVVAGVYAFINILIAGYQYMTAAGDSKKLDMAWARIWQTLMGLVLLVASFAIASLFGYLIFGDPTYILNPRLQGPN